MKRTLIILGFLALSLSCQRKNKLEKTGISITFTDKDFKEIVHLNSIELQGASDSLLLPNRLVATKDYLFLNETKTDYAVHAIKIPEDTYAGRYGAKGQGPGEILIPRFSTSGNNILRILDPKQKKVVEFDIPFLLGKKGFKKEYNTGASGHSNSVAIYNNKMYFLDQGNPEHRLFEKDLDGKKPIRGFGKLPKKEKGISDLQHGEVCYASMDNNKDLFALCYSFMPLIELFDLERNEWISIIGPEDSKPAYKNFRSRTYYNPTIRVTDRYIYALYNGKDNLGGIEREHSNIIYVFKHNGGPVRKLVLDKGIFMFDVHNDTSIYGINISDYMVPKILKFKLEP